MLRAYAGSRSTMSFDRQVGDEILMIDDTPVSEHAGRLSDRLAGEEGSRVALQLRTKGSTLTRRLSLQRTPIPIRTVTSYPLSVRTSSAQVPSAPPIRVLPSAY